MDKAKNCVDKRSTQFFGGRMKHHQSSMTKSDSGWDPGNPPFSDVGKGFFENLWLVSSVSGQSFMEND